MTPIDYGDVCVNVDLAAFAEAALPVPADASRTSLDPPGRTCSWSRTRPRPRPGLAFVLATIAHFGEDGDDTWLDYWTELRANGVQVASSWDEAYYGASPGLRRGRPAARRLVRLEPGGGGRLRPTPRPTRPPPPRSTRAATDRSSSRACSRAPPARSWRARSSTSCWRPRSRPNIPLDMFVYPARCRTGAARRVPRHALRPRHPLTLDPAAIDAGRDRWIEEWTQIVLR